MPRSCRSARAKGKAAVSYKQGSRNGTKSTISLSRWSARLTPRTSRRLPHGIPVLFLRRRPPQRGPDFALYAVQQVLTHHGTIDITLTNRFVSVVSLMQ